MKFFKDILHVSIDENPTFSSIMTPGLNLEFIKFACMYPTKEGVVVSTFYRYYLLGDKPESRDSYVLSTVTYSSPMEAVESLDCQAVYCANPMLRMLVGKANRVNLMDVIDDEEQRYIRNKTKVDMLKSFEQTTLYIKEGETFPVTNELAYTYFFENQEQESDILFDAILQ